MGTIIAIGAGIAVLGGLGAGIGIGIATGKASEAVEDSLRQKVRSVRHLFLVVHLQRQQLFMVSLSHL